MPPRKKRATTRKKKATPAKTKKAAEVPNQAEISLGMIGHVDHGKSTLTQALTGKFPDTHSDLHGTLELRLCPHGPFRFIGSRGIPLATEIH